LTDQKENVVDQSGASSEVAEADQLDDQAAETVTEPEVSASDAAWKAFPRQVQAAITYASANKYDYGPRFRNLELKYVVTSAERVTDDITRVVLSYRPTTKFRGDSGSEYLDMAVGGDVRARRQIRIAKESMPWVLMGLAMLSVIAAAVLVPVVLILEDEGDPLFVSGRTIWLRSSEPRVQPYLSYDAVDNQETLRKWIIVPDVEGAAIAWVNLTITNQTSGAVSLAIDIDAVTMTTEDNVTVSPIDVFAELKVAAEGEVLDRRLNILDLPLWGDVVLESGQEISGFMAFEVPAGSKLSSLRWSATDSATIRY
jgi:hypothetical protein